MDKADRPSVMCPNVSVNSVFIAFVGLEERALSSLKITVSVSPGNLDVNVLP